MLSAVCERSFTAKAEAKRTRTTGVVILITVPDASVQAFRRDFKLAVWLAYVGVALGVIGGGVYVSPVFTGTAAVYGGWRPEWEFWTEPSGIVSFIGLLISILSLRAGWSCLNWKGQVGEGLDRKGQGIIARSMTVAGLTIIGVSLAWLVRGVF